MTTWNNPTEQSTSYANPSKVSTNFVVRPTPVAYAIDVGDGYVLAADLTTIIVYDPSDLPTWSSPTKN